MFFILKNTIFKIVNIVILLFAFAVHLPTFGQKSTWTTYFPAHNDIIGQMALPNYIFQKIPQIEIKTEQYESYSTLSKEQQKLLELNVKQMFKYDKVTISSIKASHVYIDRISSECLNYMPLTEGNNSIDFVYSGLRADTVEIIMDKKTTADIDVSEIIKDISKFIPPTAGVPMDKIKEVLDVQVKNQNEKKIRYKIINPSVYFMIQIAGFYERPMKTISANTYASAFGEYKNSNSNKDVEVFTISKTNPISGVASSNFFQTDKGTKIDFILLYKDGDLYIKYSLYNKPTLVKIEQDPAGSGKWLYPSKQFLLRYPYSTDKNEFRYKNVYLFLDAVQTEEGIKIYNRVSQLNYPTRIEYPSVVLKFKRNR